MGKANVYEAKHHNQKERLAANFSGAEGQAIPLGAIGEK